MKEFKIRKEINNEITKGYDEDTSEVKSSSVVKWEENLSMGYHSEEKPKQQRGYSDSTSVKWNQN
jgi:hypothetical protein